MLQDELVLIEKTHHWLWCSYDLPDLYLHIVHAYPEDEQVINLLYYKLSKPHEEVVRNLTETVST